jgi:hypothetical protein
VSPLRGRRSMRSEHGRHGKQGLCGLRPARAVARPARPPSLRGRADGATLRVSRRVDLAGVEVASGGGHGEMRPVGSLWRQIRRRDEDGSSDYRAAHASTQVMVAVGARERSQARNGWARGNQCHGRR